MPKVDAESRTKRPEIEQYFAFRIVLNRAEEAVKFFGGTGIDLTASTQHARAEFSGGHLLGVPSTLRRVHEGGLRKHQEWAVKTGPHESAYVPR